MPPFPPRRQPFNGRRSICRLHGAPPPERVEGARAAGTRTAPPCPHAPRDVPRLPGGRRDGRLRSAAGHACGGDPPHLRGVGCGRRPRSASPPSAGISRRSERGHRADCAGSAARQTTPRAEKGGMKTEKKTTTKKETWRRET